MSGKAGRSTSRDRDWRVALGQLRTEVPAARAPEPFDFESKRDWERALRFAHDVIRGTPESQFPSGSSDPRSALAFALQWATANAVRGLDPICEALIRFGGHAAKKAGVERAVRHGSMYLLKFGDKSAVEEFVCQDFGSIHAATAFLVHLDEEAIRRLRERLLEKLKRDISPAVAAKVVERLARIDAHGCASTLNSLDEDRRATIWRAVSKQAQHELRQSGAQLADVMRKDRPDIAARASTLSLDEVRGLRTNGTDLETLFWLKKHGEGEPRKVAAKKIREHHERSTRPARPRAPYRVDTRLPLHRLASSWRHEDRRYALEQAPLATKSIPLFSTLILDSDVRIATRAFERLAQLSPELGRQRAVEHPRLLSTRSLRWLAKGATNDQLASLLDAFTRSCETLSADAVLLLLGCGCDAWMLAGHLAREGNGGGLGVLAAFHVHRGDAASLMRVADLASSNVAVEDRHDLLRTALSHSFRAWRYANNVGASLSSLIAALADIDYKAAYGLSLNVLGELNTALKFSRVRPLAEVIGDATTLCGTRLHGLAIKVEVDGYVIERGDELISGIEAWIVDTASGGVGDATIRVTHRDEGRCMLSLEPNQGSFQVQGYLGWSTPPALTELTEAFGEPQPDRLRDYVPLMRRLTSTTRDMSSFELGWALALTSTHDADYFERELSKLAFWVHSLKNSLRAFSTTHRPTAVITSAVDRYRAEAQRLLGVFGFHDEPLDEEFNVKLLADDVLANYGPAALVRGIRLSNSVRTDSYVRGPARQLERILSNFVANAIDALPMKGSVVITADLDTGRYELTISVLDDGPGVPTGVADDLFGASRNDRHDAVHFGMGLFEARQLALEVNGSVSLERRSEGGTAARITVPIEVADDNE